MNETHIEAIDLNLLVVLVAVLEEESATRAARRLHVTQSAVSNALARARELFNDPLFIRNGHGLIPTPRVKALAPALRDWVAQARRIVAREPSFHPETTERTFCIACADSIAIALLSPLLALMRKRAPQARLRMCTLDRLIAHDGLTRGTVDLLVGIPPKFADTHEHEHVYRDPLACVVRKDHPTVKTSLSLAEYAALPHVELALFDAIDTRVDRQLAQHGLTRVVQVALPHFASIPIAVADSDAVATLSRRLCHEFARRYPLRVFAAPIDLEPLDVVQVWDKRRRDDPALSFLRQIVLDAAREAPPSRALRRKT